MISFKLIFFILSCLVLIKADDVDQSLVDYYVELIQNRTIAAQNYRLPSDARMHEPENKTIEDDGQYDFIVIGAGSTGSIIANRLSEIEEWSVLLLEAGAFPDQELTRIPALYSIDGQTKFNWGYKTVPQANFCWSNENNMCNQARGKGIGGTSLINGLLYSRGNKLDYKKWSDSLNDSSFTYKNLFPYFLKTENFTQTNSDVPIDWKYHGTEGLLHMTQSIAPTELQAALLQGIQQLGQPLSDYNGRQQLGVNVIQSYIKNGFRDDPGLAFISTAKNRRNLRVLDGSYVMKLNISNETKRINGVIFSRNNKTFIARNRKEVILSAGVFGSPQILMLSGIGPEDHLKSLGIPVIQNLPVGRNLRDHLIATVSCSSNATFPNQTTEEQVRELLKGKGSLTAAFNLNVITFFKVPKGLPGDIPDVEIIFTNNLGGATSSPGSFSILLGILHPHSLGSLQLKSSNPFEYPLIDPNYLGDDRDLELLYEGAQIASKLTNTDALRRYNVTLALPEVEECNHIEPLSKEYWYCFLWRRTVPGNHQIGTCSTGESPEKGVVDKNLRVFGVNDLLVADASVIPIPTSNHPTATCAVIAEKISDQIKKHYNK